MRPTVPESRPQKTFYNHYESPVMLLRNVANGYARELVRVYETALAGDGRNALDAVEEALGCLQDKHGEVRVLFSPNAEGNLTRFGMEIVEELVGIFRRVFGKQLA